MISIRKFFLAAAVTLLALPAAASEFCGRAPVVDGTFSEVEWSGATRYTFLANTPDRQVVPAEIWVTNDAGQLYVAIRHQYTAATSTSAGISIDVNHSNDTDMGDDELVANWSAWGWLEGIDTFRGIDTCPTCSYADTAHGGTNDIVAGSGVANGWHTMEVSHPFSGQDVRDLRAKGGEYIALKFSNRIFGGSEELADTYYPAGCAPYVHYKLRECWVE